MAKTHQEKQDERIAAIAATYTVEELLYRINENLAAIKGWVSFWGWGTLLLAVVVAVIQAFFRIWIAGAPFSHWRAVCGLGPLSPWRS